MIYPPQPSYQQGLEDAAHFIQHNEPSLLVPQVDHLKEMAFSRKNHYLAGIADGLWILICELDTKEERLGR